MAIAPGIASDEHGVDAGSLNQTHVGLAFGAKLDSGEIVYGRIAAVRIGLNNVTIHLDGVDDAGEDFSTLHFTHHEQLWFSHYTRDAQIEGSVERIEKALTEQKR